MKKEKTLLSLILCALLFIMGCQKKPKYIELDSESFPKSLSLPIHWRHRMVLNEEHVSELNKSPIKKIDFVWAGQQVRPDEWRGAYRDLFPITHYLKINLISELIKNADAGAGATEHKLLFFTEGAIYHIDVKWDKEKIYGSWWESKKLHDYFESWKVDFRTPRPPYPKENITPEEITIDLDFWTIDEPNDSSTGNEDK